jgi:hypothetical protein
VSGQKAAEAVETIGYSTSFEIATGFLWLAQDCSV